MTGNPKASPWRSTPRAKRRRKGTQLTLSPEALAALEYLREGASRSAYVDWVLCKLEEIVRRKRGKT